MKAWPYTLSVVSTSALFLFRIRAVFWGEKKIIGFFTFLLLVLLGSCIAAPLGAEVGHNGHSTSCMFTSMKSSFCSTCLISQTAYDTLVVVSITWRLLDVVVPEETFKHRMRYLWGTRTLPTISGALLRTGQYYYLYVHFSSSHCSVCSERFLGLLWSSTFP